MKSKALRELAAVLTIIAGSAVSAAALNLFLLPENISAGGFTGIATVVNYLTGFPVGVMMLILNMPLIIIGLVMLGARFVWRTVAGVLSYSALADALPVVDITDDPMLACVFGGVLMGAGLGLVLRAGGTTGGTDLAARLISSRCPSVRISVAYFIIDAGVVAASALFIGLNAALYAAIGLAISSKTIDCLTGGASTARAYIIISERHEEIAAQIMERLGRGVTGLEARGMYTGRKTCALFCIVSRRVEAVRLRRIVKGVDDGAFMVSATASDVFGNGFSLI